MDLDKIPLLQKTKESLTETFDNVMWNTSDVVSF